MAISPIRWMRLSKLRLTRVRSILRIVLIAASAIIAGAEASILVQPDFVEVLFNEVNDGLFSFRRSQSITCPLADAIVLGDAGIPLLAPEIVLLYKANNPSHEGNRGDFEVALPYLYADRCAWLRDALLKVHPGHEWLGQL